jgi:hypothetical protein
MSDPRTAIEPHLESTHKCGARCVSWTAIVIGSLIGIGLSFLLNLFSIAIDLSSFSTTQDGLITFAIGGFIGLAIGAFASMFVAGWVAGYLGRGFCIHRNFGALYGFATWSFALILMVLLTSHASGFTAYHTNFETSLNPSVINTTISHSANPLEAAATTMRMSTQEENIINNLGKTAFVTFILFFIGAVGSCIGGYFGLEDKKK